MSAKFQSFLAVLLLSTLPLWAQNHKSAKAPATADWKDVDAAMGRAGQDQPDGTHKYALPRKDMNVTVNGVADQSRPGAGIVGGIQVDIARKRHGDGRSGARRG